MKTGLGRSRGLSIDRGALAAANVLAVGLDVVQEEGQAAHDLPGYR